MSLGEKELDTVGNEDSLLEGESLLLLTVDREMCRMWRGCEGDCEAGEDAKWTRVDVEMIGTCWGA